MKITIIAASLILSAAVNSSELDREKYLYGEIQTDKYGGWQFKDVNRGPVDSIFFRLRYNPFDERCSLFVKDYGKSKDAKKGFNYDFKAKNNICSIDIGNEFKMCVLSGLSRTDIVGTVMPSATGWSMDLDSSQYSIKSGETNVSSLSVYCV
jgi:hypothetical protein